MGKNDKNENVKNLYYRPEWTCGRYNKEKQVALMYNLIEGMSYLFEDYSAEVIGEVLSVEKNGQVSIDDVSLGTLIDKESLLPFFEELVKLGLLTTEIPTTQSIDEYRRRIGKERKEHPQSIEQNTNDELSNEARGAEKDYFDKIGGIASIMFELTYNCSEKCIHCFNPGATRNDQEVSRRGDRIELQFDDYKRIINELYDLGLTKVCLSGGDPFSKPIAWEIIDYLYHKGIATDTFTNGQSIVKDVQRLANYYPSVIGISIYSGIAEEHDYITRVKGSWERSMNVVKQLSDLGIPMNLKCCIMRPNVKSYHLVKDIAKQYGAVPQFTVQLINSLEGDMCVSRNLRLPSDVMELVLRDNNIPYYVGKEKTNYGSKKITKSPVCESFCITPEGNVQACCAFPSSLGNLKNETFAHILQHSKELDWWHTVTLENYEDCGKHEYCDYCRPCPGINFAETGNPLKPAETNCGIAKVKYGLVEKLKQGDDPLNGKTVQECLSSISIPLFDLKREAGNNYRNKKLTADG
jgi:radical SAM protein with 4Fe4S-binding SPASM domain